MKRIAVSVLALALSAVAGGAVAYQDYGNGSGYDSSYDNNDGYDNDPGYNNGRYVTTPRSDYAQVVRVEPMYSQNVSYQRQECWNEQANRYDSGYYRDGAGRLYRGNNTTGALLGALVGGALGNQVGKGDGRDAATIGGAVIGAVVGSHAGTNPGYDQYRNNAGVVTRCRTVYDNGYNNGYVNNQSVNGYHVTYRYAGQTYQAVTRYRPGRTMRVVVQVRPQDNNVAYNH